jgi:hypothetical protein
MWEGGNKGEINTQLLWEGVAAREVGEVETIEESFCTYRSLCLPKDAYLKMLRGYIEWLFLMAE